MTYPRVRASWGNVEAKTLGSRSGDKEVAFSNSSSKLTHPNLVRRLAWDIPLKNI